MASGAAAPGDSLPAERDIGQHDRAVAASRCARRCKALVAAGQLVQRRARAPMSRKGRAAGAGSVAADLFTEDMARRVAQRSIRCGWSRRDRCPGPRRGDGAWPWRGRFRRAAGAGSMSDGVPLAIERASLPAAHAARTRGGGDFALPGLAGPFGRARPARCSASRPPTWARDAQLLGVTPGAAGLRIERIGYLAPAVGWWSSPGRSTAAMPMTLPSN
jgi:GntR family transcriptional regulator